MGRRFDSTPAFGCRPVDSWRRLRMSSPRDDSAAGRHAVSRYEHLITGVRCVPDVIAAARVRCTTQRDQFPLRYFMTPRWSDLQGEEISRIGMAQFFEDARVTMFTQLMRPRLPKRASGTRAIVRSIGMEFLSSAPFGQELELTAGVTRVGNTSYSIGLGIFAADRCLAVGETTVVLIGENRRPLPVRDELRQILQENCVPSHEFPRTDLADPARLPVESYPFSIEWPTRFSDTDAVGHLNNVAIFRYHDNLSMAFQLHCAGSISPRTYAGSWRVARSDVSLRRETFYPEAVRMCCAVRPIGDKHFVLTQAMFQGEHCTGLSDIVIEVIPSANSAVDLRDVLEDYGLRGRK
jgi:acyl-CoA thioester hydrolase